MKLHILSFIFLAFSISVFGNSPLTSEFTWGDPGVKSINAITFGPDGILFIGDSESAMVHAIDLSKHKKADNSKVNIAKIDEIIANALGATTKDFQIVDIVVNPANGNLYLAIQHTSGSSALLRLAGTMVENVPLSNVFHSNSTIEKAVSADAKDRRGGSMRKWAVSDLEYADGKVMVSGLSTAEFGATFQLIPFPFKKEQNLSSLEIYHAAHGKYETESPVKSFIPIEINGKKAMVAGYTCTPLVVFGLDDIQQGAKTKGRTVAELGNMNTPVDIIAMDKGSNKYILIANSSRSLMKVNVADIEKFKGSLDSPVSGTAGVEFVALPFEKVQQMAKVNADTFVILHTNDKGELTLQTQGSSLL